MRADGFPDYDMVIVQSSSRRRELPVAEGQGGAEENESPEVALDAETSTGGILTV